MPKCRSTSSHFAQDVAAMNFDRSFAGAQFISGLLIKADR
jgi:hypothetical protein